MKENERLTDRFVNWMRYSISLKFVVIGLLSFLLLIPLQFVKEIISERKFRQSDVVEEVNQKWGHEVFLYGPMLKIPYKTYSNKQKIDPETEKVIIEREEHIRTMYIFPDSLDINGELKPYTKKRGIYNTVVFSQESQISGLFKFEERDLQGIRPDHIFWNEAKMMIMSSNLKGITSDIHFNLNGQSFEVHPYFSNEMTFEFESSDPYYYEIDYRDRNISLKSLQSDFLNSNFNELEKGMEFSINMDINGSRKVRFVPVGKTTTVSLKSTWESPSFTGEFLPYNDNKLDGEGFDAKWKVLNVNRGFGQIQFGSLPNLVSYGFGVELMVVVDEYLQNERSVKYGYLIIILTFLVFFLIQVVSKINIHFFQYTLIGLALVIFYVLLISITEHTNFFTSYLISSLSVIGLISLYSSSILKKRKFAILIASSLMALYLFILVIIQLESYSLLVGSIGLFVILATIMYFTRKIEWRLGKGD
jgi:inner membrane protein